MIDELYRGKVGAYGSTADTVRIELATGELIGGKSHLQKARDYVRALERWINRDWDTASPEDVQAAHDVLEDLREALRKD